MDSIAVVGAGVIGLSVAWQSARAGYPVTLYDAAPMSGASWVAGGMLAPLSEGWPGEEAVLDFGAASLARWPEFARQLRDSTGESVFAPGAGVLTVALDAADVADLHTIATWLDELGHRVRECTRAQLRDLEPALGRAVRLGLLAEDELAVDNRALLAALHLAAMTAGVEFVARAVVDLAEIGQDTVILAAGCHSVELWPQLPVRPVQGEALRVRISPGVAPAPTRTVRARVHGRPVYLVPRSDGIVVGATQYEASAATVTVAGIRDLIADAEVIFPSLGQYELVETVSGTRPMTPDNLPLIGRLSDRVVVATGHGRNGMLTAPLTAEAVLAELAGERLTEAKAADPHRFPGVWK